ncbi:MAG: hypothetical protein QXP70_00280 [Methanomassiliicoccales archaeon]
MKEFSVVLAKRTEIAQLADLLGRNGINILTLAMEPDGGEGGRVHFVTSDDATCRQLMRQKFDYSESEIITISIDDKPGSLARLLSKLNRASVGVNSIYIINRKNGRVEFVLGLQDVERGKTLLFEKLKLEKFSGSE